MEITLNLTLSQLKKFNELLFKGLAYDDAYYDYRTERKDEKIYALIGEAISQQTPYKQSMNGYITKNFN